MGNKGKFGQLRIAAGYGDILCAVGQTEEVVEPRTPPELCVEFRIALAHDATPIRFHEAVLPRSRMRSRRGIQTVTSDRNASDLFVCKRLRARATRLDQIDLEAEHL